MPFPNKDTQFQPGESGNPEGKKPGTIHLSTHIQQMLNDPDFELKLKDGSVLNERPIKAIIKTAVAKGISGSVQWAEWLAKHGYGTKVTIATEDPIEALLKAYGIKGGDDDGQADEAVSGSSSDKA